jgi:hypothetical protein
MGASLGSTLLKVHISTSGIWTIASEVWFW